MSYILSAPYDDIYETFLEYQRPRVSAQGFISLEGHTRRFLHWLSHEDLLPEDVTIQDAVRYQAYLSQRTNRVGNTIASGTMQNYLKAARSLFRYLSVIGKVSTNPFMEIPYPQIGDHVSRNSLSESQMSCLLSKLSRFDELPTPFARLRRYRVHVIAEFLYASGLRIAEAASLIEANLDLDHRLIYLPEGKGGSPRTAFLTGYASEVLKLYLARGRSAVLGGYVRNHGQTIFGADKSRLAIVLNEELKKVCAELEIPVITSHGFRHSLGTHLLRAGCDMRYIQIILGHESLGSTQVYTKVDKDDLKRSLDAFHPRKYQNNDEKLSVRV
ncbi:MAG TPA: tyrosine-type recombinase/integrase [Sphaerochaeta sp.]|nr:tyrosine-type recombinase/integrase [Sphaerochaeta sp.]